jgi:(2Fe-2S) ferredoxin
LSNSEQAIEFILEGRFVSFVGDLGEKLKRLKLATGEGERDIKLSKELRVSLPKVLQAGDWIEISGKQKLKYKTGELKLKALQVKLKAPNPHQKVFQPAPAAPKTKAYVMVCQKSSCRQRGAGDVCQAVTTSLRDRGLEDQVVIKGTGCMKQCKSGPCVVFMPDKSRYSGVAPKQIPGLIEKHFAGKLKPEVNKSELSGVT